MGFFLLTVRRRFSFGNRGTSNSKMRSQRNASRDGSPTKLARVTRVTHCTSLADPCWPSFVSDHKVTARRLQDLEQTCHWPDEEATDEPVPGPNTLLKRTRAGGKFGEVERESGSDLRVSMRLRSLTMEWTWSTKIVMTNKPNRHDSMQMTIEWTLERRSSESEREGETYICDSDFCWKTTSDQITSDIE